MERKGDPEYDLVVLGGGVAGLTIGKYAPQFGARVAIVEAQRLGGDCTWYGCVPSKALIASANIAATTKRAESFGLPPVADTEPVNLALVLERVHDLQHHIYEESDSPDALRANGCDVIEGRGRFTSPHTLDVDGRQITARAFCIATGSHPAVPPIDGLDQIAYHTNRTIFDLKRLPRRLLVIGGGPIGVEIGQAMSRLGAHVTIVEMAPRLLPREDDEVSDVLRQALTAEGIDIRTDVVVTHIAEGEGVKRARLAPAGHAPDDAPDQYVECDTVFVAAGQLPNVDGLGLDEAGVAYDARTGIHVDDGLRTSNRHIYAAGDVIGRLPFTHVAALEASTVMRNALFPRRQKIDYSAVPWATFTDPEIARVGLTEEEARVRYGDDLHVSHFPFSRNDRAIMEGRTTGFVKLLSVGKRDRLVGAHIVGPSAGELIHQHVLAMQHGIGVSALAETMHIYPTLSETSRYAALGRFNLYLRSSTVRRLFNAYRRYQSLPRLSIWPFRRPSRWRHT